MDAEALRYFSLNWEKQQGLSHEFQKLEITKYRNVQGKYYIIYKIHHG